MQAARSPGRPVEQAQNQFYYSCWHGFGFGILWPWHTKCPRTPTATRTTNTSTSPSTGRANVGSLALAPVIQDPPAPILRPTPIHSLRIYYFICISYKSHGYVTHMHKTPAPAPALFEFLPITEYKRVQTGRRQEANPDGDENEAGHEGYCAKTSTNLYKFSINYIKSSCKHLKTTRHVLLRGLLGDEGESVCGTRLDLLTQKRTKEEKVQKHLKGFGTALRICRLIK